MKEWAKLFSCTGVIRRESEKNQKRNHLRSDNQTWTNSTNKKASYKYKKLMRPHAVFYLHFIYQNLSGHSLVNLKLTCGSYRLTIREFSVARTLVARKTSFCSGSETAWIQDKLPLLLSSCLYLMRSTQQMLLWQYILMV